MKPSEQIEKRAKSLVEEFREELYRTDREFDPVAATATMQAVLDHLDEQHDLDRRRRLLVRALFTRLEAAPGTGASPGYVLANELLEKAGLKARFPGMRAVMAEAEREGLL